MKIKRKVTEYLPEQPFITGAGLDGLVEQHGIERLPLPEENLNTKEIEGVRAD